MSLLRSGYKDCGFYLGHSFPLSLSARSLPHPPSHPCLSEFSLWRRPAALFWVALWRSHGAKEFGQQPARIGGPQSNTPKELTSANSHAGELGNRLYPHWAMKWGLRAWLKFVRDLESEIPGKLSLIPDAQKLQDNTCCWNCWVWGQFVLQ